MGENKLTINQTEMNSLIQLLTSILERPPSLIEIGKMLEIIGTLNELELDKNNKDRDGQKC